MKNMLRSYLKYIHKKPRLERLKEKAAYKIRNSKKSNEQRRIEEIEALREEKIRGIDQAIFECSVLAPQNYQNIAPEPIREPKSYLTHSVWHYLNVIKRFEN
jgi:hypothetical protein